MCKILDWIFDLYWIKTQSWYFVRSYTLYFFCQKIRWNGKISLNPNFLPQVVKHLLHIRVMINLTVSRRDIAAKIAIAKVDHEKKKGWTDYVYLPYRPWNKKLKHDTTLFNVFCVYILQFNEKKRLTFDILFHFKGQRFQY